MEGLETAEVAGDLVKKKAWVAPAVLAAGQLATTIGQGMYASAQARENARREAELLKGKQLADIYSSEGQQKASALANLIEAYRSAMLR